MRKLVMQVAVLEVDKVLAAGHWPSGEELTDEDVVWLNGLVSRVIAAATFG